MHVTEHLDRAKNPLFSYEIIPPPRGRSARDILDIVEQVLPYNPPFIDVTSHSAEAQYNEQDDGSIRRKISRKRPGTISICGIIQNRYNIDTVPHLLCHGFTCEETEDAMIELNFLGIHNILAIRGDEPNFKKHIQQGHRINSYAVDLVRQLGDLRTGRYLEDIANSAAMDICIGVGGYPEKHYESPNIKMQLNYLKAKVDAGADYIVTQMFFDNKYFFKFVEDCRDIGITVPIIPGLKVLRSAKQLYRIPKKFFVTFPDDIVDELATNPKHARELGIEIAVRQCEELLNSGVKCLHFYVMNDAASVLEVVRRLG